MAKQEIETLLSLAIKQGSPVEVISELLKREQEIKREMQRSTFIKAKVRLQSNMPLIKKNIEVVTIDKDGKMTGYNYAPDEEIKKVIQPYLKKYGFTYRYEFTGDEQTITCTCFLAHIDGYEEKSSMTSNRDNSEDMNNIQSIGSTRTYLQRYTLSSVLGLSFDQDNDGRTAKDKENKREKIPAPKKKQAKKTETVEDELNFKEGEAKNDKVS